MISIITQCRIDIYFNFAKEELTTGTYASYSLNQKSCRFSVTFHEEEFAFVEKFY